MNSLDEIAAEFRHLADHSDDGIIPVNAKVIADRIESAIAEERESNHESAAFDLLEKYAEAPDEKLTESACALKHKLLRLGSSSSRQNHGRFESLDTALSTYKHETGEVVYDQATLERFCQWLYMRRCDDACPYYRIVETDEDGRPRCCSPVGPCTTVSNP